MAREGKFTQHFTLHQKSNKNFGSVIFSSPRCILLLLSPTQARVCGVLPLIRSINCYTEVKVDGSTPKRWRIVRRYDKLIYDYYNYIYQKQICASDVFDDTLRYLKQNVLQ